MGSGTLLELEYVGSQTHRSIDSPACDTTVSLSLLISASFKSNLSLLETFLVFREAASITQGRGGWWGGLIWLSVESKAAAHPDPLSSVAVESADVFG